MKLAKELKMDIYEVSIFSISYKIPLTLHNTDTKRTTLPSQGTEIKCHLISLTDGSS